MAADAYEAFGPGPPRGAEGSGVNLQDNFARLHLARMCAMVVHSDQAAGDVGRDGAPFWRMLVLLATRWVGGCCLPGAGGPPLPRRRRTAHRPPAASVGLPSTRLPAGDAPLHSSTPPSRSDPVDMVRFGAMEAMTGVVASASASLAGVASAKPAPGGGGSREEVVARQRRGRAWRLLVSQAGMAVTVPGAAAPAAREGPGAPPQPPPPSMRLIDVLGRLLVLALHKAESAARLTVAAGVAGSLAESCLASQASGAGRHGSSAEVDRVMAILASELGSLLEAPLPPSARAAAVEALLLMQAAGHSGGGLTPAKVLAGGAGAGGLQDALLAAVLRCARAKPKEAVTFLGYAAAVVGMAPAGLDLSKITDLWDAAAATGREGRAAVLAAALEVLSSGPPPAAAPRPGGGEAEVARAAREEDGWNAFVATAVWWLGEHANVLCDEYCGRRLPHIEAPVAPGGAGLGKENGGGSAAAGAALLARYAGRKPTLARLIDALHGLALTGVWQLRLAAARALAKLALRSGEPYRLRVYSLLAGLAGTAGGGGAAADPLGLAAVARPALALLDRVYSTQVGGVCVGGGGGGGFCGGILHLGHLAPKAHTTHTHTRTRVPPLQAVLEGLWAQHGDDVEGWPPEVVASLQRRSRELTLAAERSVCSLPRDKYVLLGQVRPPRGGGWCGSRAAWMQAAGAGGGSLGCLGCPGASRQQPAGHRGGLIPPTHPPRLPTHACTPSARWRCWPRARRRRAATPPSSRRGGWRRWVGEWGCWCVWVVVVVGGGAAHRRHGHTLCCTECGGPSDPPFQEASGLSERVGSELAASKSREVDAILGARPGGGRAAGRLAAAWVGATLVRAAAAACHRCSHAHVP